MEKSLLLLSLSFLLFFKLDFVIIADSVLEDKAFGDVGLIFLKGDLVDLYLFLFFLDSLENSKLTSSI